MMNTFIKWGLYAVSFGTIGYVTWDMPIGSYIMVQLAVLGIVVSGVIE
jgi:hypothetical protein